MLRKKTPALLPLFRFANMNVWYYMILSTPSLAGDFYLNFFLGCVAEIPAYTVAIFVIKYVIPDSKVHGANMGPAWGRPWTFHSRLLLFQNKVGTAFGTVFYLMLENHA